MCMTTVMTRVVNDLISSFSSNVGNSGSIIKECLVF